MNKMRKEIEMGFTEGSFLEGTHICLIYDNDEQRKMVIGQFLAKGIAMGERAIYFADTTTPEEVETWLKEAGWDFHSRNRDDEFVVASAKDVYYPSGRFDPSEMLARVCNCYGQAVQAGYPGARGSGEMSWALKGIPGSERLMEYEAMINTINEEYPVTPICQYDARLFDGATLLNALKVHPLMIVAGQVVQNPYYIHPQEFLEKFREGSE